MIIYLNKGLVKDFFCRKKILKWVVLNAVSDDHAGAYLPGAMSERVKVSEWLVNLNKSQNKLALKLLDLSDTNQPTNQWELTIYIFVART